MKWASTCCQWRILIQHLSPSDDIFRWPRELSSSPGCRADRAQGSTFQSLRNHLWFCVGGVGLAASLEIKAGPFEGKRVAVLGGQTVLVGRAPQKANFAVPHDTFMSGLHFAVDCGPEGCRITDRNSANGTFLNGAKITAAALKEGDEIRAGQTTFVVRMRDEGIEPPVAKPVPAPPQAATPSQPAPAVPPPAPRSAPPPVPPAASLAAALSIGSWSFAGKPDGWEIQEGYGLQRSDKDSFPSNVVASEEMLPGGMSLQQFVEAQVKMLRQYWREPQIEASLPPQIRGAEETVALDARHKTKDGQQIFYRRIYARRGRLVGILTFTTLDSDLPQVKPAFDAIISRVAFEPRA